MFHIFILLAIGNIYLTNALFWIGYKIPKPLYKIAIVIIYITFILILSTIGSLLQGYTYQH